MDDKPASDKKPHSQENGQDGQPISLAPPKSQEETDTKNHTGDLAGDNVEAAEDQERADQRRTEIASWKRDGALSADHVRHTTFARVERDGFDATSCTDSSNCVSELMESNHQHLASSISRRFTDEPFRNGVGD